MKRIAVSAGVLVALVAVAALAVGGVGATTQADTGNENNSSFGAEISSFMQASSAEAEGEVDDGMFNAAMDRTDDPDERRALIERRQERLQERQAKLEERRSRISTDDGTDVRDRALAAHVAVGASNLERSVNGTERAARASGMDTESLDEIRTNARNLRGSEVAELAGGLGAARSAGDRGPPTDRGNGDGRSAGQSDDRSNSSNLPVDVGSEDYRGDGNNTDRRSGGQNGSQPDGAGPPEDDSENDDPPNDERGNADGDAQADSDD